MATKNNEDLQVYEAARRLADLRGTTLAGGSAIVFRMRYS